MLTLLRKIQLKSFYFSITILLFAPFFCFSCKKYDTGPVVDSYSSNQYFISFNDAGDPKIFRQTENNIINEAQSLYYFQTYNETSLFAKNTGGNTGSFSISFAKIFDSNPYQYQTDSLFTTQRYTYFGAPTSRKTTVILTYIDENGFTWTSQSNNSNDQIGSFVNIYYSFPEGGDGFRYTVKGNFNCILYNASSPGQYKNITNGSFTAKFGYGN